MRLRELMVCGLLVAVGVGGIAFGRDPDPTPDTKPRKKRKSKTGTLAVTVRDDRGAKLPARLTFRPVGDTRRVYFTTTDIAREDTGAVSAFDRAFVLRGDADLRVPVGTYDVWASHGPEWDTSRERVTIAPDAETELDVRLHHVVDTPGWISGDFHVHAAPSLDSRVPLRHRLHQFIADGVDLIVSTDHNIISDYAPIIAELGVGDLIASALGDEITTKSWGHFGAFPLVADEGELGNGAVATGARTPAQIFGDVRATAPDALVDVHHPRLEHGHIGYFHLAQLDPKTGVAKRAGFSFDFDAIEVLNGYQDPDRAGVALVVADWIGFLDSGKHVTATGNSDSHHMTFNLGGYPRNYVRVPPGPLANLDARAVAAAVKAGHAFFTTGPIVEAEIAGKSYGDVVAAPTGKVALAVKVRAANWIATTKITVLGVGGAVLATRTIPPAVASTSGVRFDDVIPLELAGDGYAIVRVDGDRAMAPNVGDQGAFLVYPLAIANPIWIDVDGDGKVTPAKPWRQLEEP